jgi:NADPH2:quinone reductase
MAMYGIQVSELGGPEVLSYVEISQPAPGLRGTLALFGASSGPVPPLDPQRLNAAGSVYLTRPSRIHFVRSREEFAWRTGELLDLVGADTIAVRVSAHYPLRDAADAHRDLQGRKTTGSVILTP